MRPLADGIRGFPRLVRDLARQLGKQVRFEVRRRPDRRRSRHPRQARGPALPPDSQRHRPRPGDAGRAGGRRQAGHRARSGSRPATGPGCSTSRSPTTAAASTSSSSAQRAVDQGLVTQAVAEQLGETGTARVSVPARLLHQGAGHGNLRPRRRPRRRAEHGQGGRRKRPGRHAAGTADGLHAPAADHDVGDPGPAGGDRRRALRLPADPDRPHPPLPHERIRTVEGRQYFDHDGTAIGLGAGGPDPRAPRPAAGRPDAGGRWSATAGQQFGMIVDAFLGERDLEVRPLDTRLGKVPDINSASLLENGEPVLIVDVEDLVRSIDNVLAGRRLSRVEFDEARRGGPAAEADPGGGRLDHRPRTGAAAAPVPRLRGRRGRGRHGRLERRSGAPPTT